MSGEFPEWYKHDMPSGQMLQGDQFIDRPSDNRAGKVVEDVLKTIKYVDPDWLLNKPGQQYEKAQQGKAGIFFSGVRDIAFDNSANSVQKKTKEITGVQSAEWQPFHPWEKTGVGTESLPGTPFQLSAKSGDAKLKRTVQILDWLASEEGFMLTHYGQEGVHYKKNGKKIEILADAVKRDITDNGNFLEIYGGIFGLTGVDASAFGYEIVDPKETDRDRAILAKIKSYKYLPSLGTNVAPPPGADLGQYRANLNKYLVKMLLEEKSASNWPKYRTELMTTYKGKEIFDSYAQQISKAQGKTYRFVSENQ